MLSNLNFNLIFQSLKIYDTSYQEIETILLHSHHYKERFIHGICTTGYVTCPKKIELRKNISQLLLWKEIQFLSGQNEWHISKLPPTRLQKLTIKNSMSAAFYNIYIFPIPIHPFRMTNWIWEMQNLIRNTIIFTPNLFKLYQRKIHFKCIKNVKTLHRIYCTNDCTQMFISKYIINYLYYTYRNSCLYSFYARKCA